MTARAGLRHEGLPGRRGELGTGVSTRGAGAEQGIRRTKSRGSKPYHAALTAWRPLACRRPSEAIARDLPHQASVRRNREEKGRGVGGEGPRLPRDSIGSAGGARHRIVPRPASRPPRSRSLDPGRHRRRRVPAGTPHRRIVAPAPPSGRAPDRPCRSASVAGFFCTVRSGKMPTWKISEGIWKFEQSG
jgi:hypothetical protein